MQHTRKHKKRRIPRLSDKPEPGTGRYYASFRGHHGKPKRQRFTKDRDESQMLYHRWIVENYDETAQIITKGRGADKGSFEQSLPVIANAYIRHEKARVRHDGARRARGTVGIRVFDDNRRQIVNILRWCKDHFTNRLARESFAELMTETDYEAMMLHFVNRFSTSQINKHRQRFWELVRFARREPFAVKLGFDPEDVRSFGGTERRRPRQTPTVKMIRQLLSAASERERLWIWMGIGLGFGNDDLARCRFLHFDSETYDMRRGKTGFPRYGIMRPMVWAHLQEYLEKCPRQNDELLFITRNGHPLVWVHTKTEDEIQNGTSTRGPAETPFKRSDTVGQTWNKLKKKTGLGDWKEGFYIWRHLGAIAYASLPGTGIAQLRTFLGHGKSEAADEYLKPLTPEIKEVVAWMNKMLESGNPDKWRDGGS